MSSKIVAQLRSTQTVSIYTWVARASLKKHGASQPTNKSPPLACASLSYAETLFYTLRSQAADSKDITNPITTLAGNSRHRAIRQQCNRAQFQVSSENSAAAPATRAPMQKQFQAFVPPQLHFHACCYRIIYFTRNQFLQGTSNNSNVGGYFPCQNYWKLQAALALNFFCLLNAEGIFQGVFSPL